MSIRARMARSTRPRSSPTRTSALVALLLAGCGDPPTTCESWHQWGGDPEHAGASCVAGQPLGKQLADIIYDPFIPQEVADAQGDLLVHYQAPLLDGDDIFMMAKGGTYTPCQTANDQPACFLPTEMFRLDSQVWSEKLYRWDDAGLLYEKRSFDSDWK